MSEILELSQRKVLGIMHSILTKGTKNSSNIGVVQSISLVSTRRELVELVHNGINMLRHLLFSLQ